MKAYCSPPRGPRCDLYHIRFVPLPFKLCHSERAKPGGICFLRGTDARQALLRLHPDEQNPHSLRRRHWVGNGSDASAQGFTGRYKIVR